MRASLLMKSLRSCLDQSTCVGVDWSGSWAKFYSNPPQHMWIEMNLRTSKQGLKRKIIQQRSIIEVQKHTLPLDLAAARCEVCTQIAREEQWAGRAGGGGGRLQSRWRVWIQYALMDDTDFEHQPWTITVTHWHWLRITNKSIQTMVASSLDHTVIRTVITCFTARSYCSAHVHLGTSGKKNYHFHRFSLALDIERATGGENPFTAYGKIS
jgi:hypothetical protein